MVTSHASPPSDPLPSPLLVDHKLPITTGTISISSTTIHISPLLPLPPPHLRFAADAVTSILERYRHHLSLDLFDGEK